MQPSINSLPVSTCRIKNAHKIKINCTFFSNNSQSCCAKYITLRMAIVLLAHHSAPFENSAGILFLSKTCLKSEIFNSFMNVELCGGTSESTTGSNANAFG